MVLTNVKHYTPCGSFPHDVADRGVDRTKHLIKTHHLQFSRGQHEECNERPKAVRPATPGARYGVFQSLPQDRVKVLGEVGTSTAVKKEGSIYTSTRAIARLPTGLQ